MLKGISPVVSPELLAVLSAMGHGDEIVLADAHFPGETMGKRCLRADGLSVVTLLEGILPLFELDGYVPAPVVMMAPKAGVELGWSFFLSLTLLALIALNRSPHRDWLRLAGVMAGLCLGMLESYSTVLIPEAYKDVVAICVLLAVLFVKPTGLFGSRAAAALSPTAAYSRSTSKLKVRVSQAPATVVIASVSTVCVLSLTSSNFSRMWVPAAGE